MYYITSFSGRQYKSYVQGGGGERRPIKFFPKGYFNSIFSMRYITVLLIVLLLSQGKAYGASWGAVDERVGHTATFTWGWPDENDLTPICNASQCIVTVGPWDPGGGPPFGGINNPYHVFQKVVVNSGATTRDAFIAWTNKYGIGGQYRQLMWHDGVNTSNTCFGFQSFVGAGGNYRTGTLLPGTTCGLVPPPNLTCDVYLGSEINLGVVPRGASGVSGGVDGSVTCSSSATIYSSLINRPELDGNNVAISINGVKLNNQPHGVGRGKQVSLNVVANIEGKLDNAGVYETSTIILFSYQ